MEKKINIRGLEIDEVSRTVMLYGEESILRKLNMIFSLNGSCKESCVHN